MNYFILFLSLFSIFSPSYAAASKKLFAPPLTFKKQEKEVSYQTVADQLKKNTRKISPALTRALWNAVKYNNPDEVESLLQGRLSLFSFTRSFPDINNRRGEYTPLIWACQMGLKEIAELLLNAGARADEAYLTALRLAVSLGHTDIVKLLLDAGADVNWKDEWGKTPLMWASLPVVVIETEKGRVEIVKLLLNAGADINIRDNKGNTALMYASKYNHAAVVKLLLDAGANPYEELAPDATDLTDSGHFLPDVQAVYKAYEKLHNRKHLHGLQGVAQQAMNAICPGKVEGMRDPARLVQQYLRTPPTTQQQEIKKEEEQQKVVAVVEISPEQEKRNRELLAALHKKETKPQEVEKLLQYGADIAARDKVGGYTPLILTVIYNRADLARVLLDAISQNDDEEKYLEAVDVHGNTALSWAERLNRSELLDLLIETGARKY